MTEVPLLKKLHVLVPHWRAHNDEHIAEMEKYLHALEAEGQNSLANRCRETLVQMTLVSEKLALMAQQLKPVKLPEPGERDVR
ncbi:MULTISPECIES: hypothetical protein [Enterobacteriaceae]|uniref:hypothetical protein n=1 Tax=Enterobacteriaceae TaxID=543 RepID=UPI00024F1E6F|nr:MULTISPECIES: hypothetical protein [Enterobacteriaceae]EFC6552367.1 hypothetical protein [Escherichia coli]EBB7791855.1 hypothetical protein [Salmonella enterica subsp. enterica serovar Senftenberg]EBF7042222.1 hypothetical protein [Salmonella enterica subsp. enterica serovar Senftenberg]EFL7416973.1 hypothetical protein [Escherichia coli]EFN4126694.1 hypothetical protein [Escherichia coli]